MTNKNDANKAAVLSALDSLRAALKDDGGAAIAPALEQCDRLELAIQQFHAEGLRFAAFTLLHLVQRGGAVFTEPVHSATQGLEDALDAAGYPH